MSGTKQNFTLLTIDIVNKFNNNFFLCKLLTIEQKLLMTLLTICEVFCMDNEGILSIQKTSHVVNDIVSDFYSIVNNLCKKKIVIELVNDINC